MAPAILLHAATLAALAAGASIDRVVRGQDPPSELLLEKGRFAGKKVAAISVEMDSDSFLYVHKQGLWRCREAYGAVCDDARIHGLLEAFFDARVVSRAAGEDAEASCGFLPERQIAVGFHGSGVLEDPGRDVLVRFEVGRSLDLGPRGRAFVRERGSQRILEIDRDPRRALRTDEPTLPPLVNARFLAGSLAGEFRGFREIRIAPVGGEAIRIVRDPSAPPDPSAPWILERGGEREKFPGWRVGGYIGLWLRSRFDSFENPGDAAELGLDPPAAEIVLVPERGAPIELAVGTVDAKRRARVLNRTTNVVGTVPAELQPLLAPRAELFIDTTRPNPWDKWLRKP